MQGGERGVVAIDAIGPVVSSDAVFTRRGQRCSVLPLPCTCHPSPAHPSTPPHPSRQPLRWKLLPADRASIKHCMAGQMASTTRIILCTLQRWATPQRVYFLHPWQAEQRTLPWSRRRAAYPDPTRGTTFAWPRSLELISQNQSYFINQPQQQ